EDLRARQSAHLLGDAPGGGVDARTLVAGAAKAGVHRADGRVLRAVAAVDVRRPPHVPLPLPAGGAVRGAGDRSDAAAPDGAVARLAAGDGDPVRGGGSVGLRVLLPDRVVLPDQRAGDGVADVARVVGVSASRQ